jgi:hypothetical protein
MTAIITMRDRSEGTEYSAHVMHKNDVDRVAYEATDFYDGWGTVGEQFASLVDPRP